MVEVQLQSWGGMNGVTERRQEGWGGKRCSVDIQNSQYLLSACHVPSTGLEFRNLRQGLCPHGAHSLAGRVTISNEPTPYLSPYSLLRPGPWP